MGPLDVAGSFQCCAVPLDLDSSSSLDLDRYLCPAPDPAPHNQLPASPAHPTQADAFLTMNERFLSTARQHNACHTCGRPFHGAGELEAFLARQERERAKLPSARGAWEAALRDAEARLARLQGLAPIAARHDRLRDATLPELEAACSGPESALATARGEAELREEGVAEAVHLLQEARGLLETVAWPADKLAAEIRFEISVGRVHVCAWGLKGEDAVLQA